MKVTPGRWQETKGLWTDSLNPFKFSFSLTSPFPFAQRPLPPPALSPKCLSSVSLQFCSELAPLTGSYASSLLLTAEESQTCPFFPSSCTQVGALVNFEARVAISTEGIKCSGTTPSQKLRPCKPSPKPRQMGIPQRAGKSEQRELAVSKRAGDPPATHAQCS